MMYSSLLERRLTSAENGVNINYEHIGSELVLEADLLRTGSSLSHGLSLV